MTPGGRATGEAAPTTVGSPRGCAGNDAACLIPGPACRVVSAAWRFPVSYHSQPTRSVTPRPALTEQERNQERADHSVPCLGHSHGHNGRTVAFAGGRGEIGWVVAFYDRKATLSVDPHGELVNCGARRGGPSAVVLIAA